MRKSWAAPAAALFLGAAGAYLRSIELDTAFEEGSGLLKEFGPVSIALTALSVFALLAAAVYGAAAAKGLQTGPDYGRAFSCASPLSFALSALCGAAAAAGGVLFFLAPSEPAMSSPVLFIFTLFAVLSGLSVIALAAAGRARRDSGLTCAASAVPELFFCFWMAIEYRKYASTPTLLFYCYRCVALAAAALSFYYAAGCAFGRAKPRMTVVSHLWAIYFLTLTLADTHAKALELVLAAALAATVLNAARFLRGLRPAGGAAEKNTAE